MNPNDTGPWGLKELERVLEPATNKGTQYREVSAIGGTAAVLRDDGPYSFRCGCTAQVIAIGGTLSLSPCGAAHRTLAPKLTG